MTAFVRQAGTTLRDRVLSDSVVLIQGPRSVGKSTLLSAFAAERNVNVLDLDHRPTRLAVAQDPSFFVKGPGPICIDEYQKAPELLDAIKVELGRDGSPGRFILAGSSNFEALPQGTQALTGRLTQVLIEPLAQCEIGNTEVLELDQLFDPQLFQNLELGLTSREEYVLRVLRGGFPLAIGRSEADRVRWVDDYLRIALSRDVEDVGGVRNPASLKRVLQLVASRTGQVLNIDAISDKAGVNRLTADRYVQLLAAVFLVQELPAWGTTLGSRVAKRSKVHVVDSLVAGRLMRLTEDKLGSKNSSSLTQFGHVLESFVVAELRRISSFGTQVQQLGHWRESDETEVDLVLEDSSGQIRGFEVKASTSVGLKDAQGLRELARKVGSDFHLGALLYLGNTPVRLDEKIWALPLDVLWAQRK